MPLIRGAAPGSRGFGQNIKTEETAGKPQKQAVAIAYSESRRHSADAPPRSAAVKVIGGADPGEQSLQPVQYDPLRYQQAAGRPWGVPPNGAAEPLQSPIVSKTPHEPQTVHPTPVIASEPLLRVANASGTDRRTVRTLGEDEATTAPEGGRSDDGGDPDEGRGEGDLTSIPSAPHAPGVAAARDAESVPGEVGPDDGAEMGNEPVSMDEHVGFKAVEKHAESEGARDPAAVAAAVGIKKYGVAGMEKKAAAGRDELPHNVPALGDERHEVGDEDLPDPVEEANRVNRSPPVY